MILQLPSSNPLPDTDFLTVGIHILIAQVVFTDLLAIEKTKTAASIQAALGHEYPFLGQDVVQIAGGTLSSWRFTDLTQKWVLSICRNSISLTSRGSAGVDELVGRLDRAIAAVSSVARPTAPVRAGVRCIFRQDVNGGHDGPLRPDLTGMSTRLGDVRHHVSETHVNTPEGEMAIRYAKLSPGTSYAPNEVPPVAEATWVFDVDSFKHLEITAGAVKQGHAFDVKAIAEVTRSLAMRAAHVVDGCLSPLKVSTGMGNSPTRH